MDIKELRKRTGLSQAKFAKKFSIGVSTIQHWEQGVSAPPDYVVEMMNELLDLDEELQRLKDAGDRPDPEYVMELKKDIKDGLMPSECGTRLFDALALKYLADTSQKSITFNDDELREILGIDNMENVQEYALAGCDYIMTNRLEVRTENMVCYVCWLKEYTYDIEKGLVVYPNEGFNDYYVQFFKDHDKEGSEV